MLLQVGTVSNSRIHLTRWAVTALAETHRSSNYYRALPGPRRPQPAGDANVRRSFTNSEEFAMFSEAPTCRQHGGRCRAFSRCDHTPDDFGSRIAVPFPTRPGTSRAGGGMPEFSEVPSDSTTAHPLESQKRGRIGCARGFAGAIAATGRHHTKPGGHHSASEEAVLTAAFTCRACPDTALAMSPRTQETVTRARQSRARSAPAGDANVRCLLRRPLSLAVRSQLALFLEVMCLTAVGCSSSTVVQRSALPTLAGDASGTSHARLGKNVTLLLDDHTKLKGKLIRVSCRPETTLVVETDNASSVDPFAGRPDTVSVPLRDVRRIMTRSTPGGAVIAAGFFVGIVIVAVAVEPKLSFHPD